MTEAEARGLLDQFVPPEQRFPDSRPSRLIWRLQPAEASSATIVRTRSFKSAFRMQYRHLIAVMPACLTYGM